MPGICLSPSGEAKGVGMCVGVCITHRGGSHHIQNLENATGIRRLQHIILHKFTGNLNLPVSIDRCKCTSEEMHMHVGYKLWIFSIIKYCNAIKKLQTMSNMVVACINCILLL